MRIRNAVLAAVVALIATPVALAGVVIQGGGPKLATVHAAGLRSAALHGHVRSLVWTDRTGRTRRETVPVDLNLDSAATLLPPPGEWTDLTLVLDGPVTLTGTTLAGAPTRLSADLGAWTVPLEAPGSAPLILDLALPAGLSSPADLAVALQDGALAR